MVSETALLAAGVAAGIGAEATGITDFTPLGPPGEDDSGTAPGVGPIVPPSSGPGLGEIAALLQASDTGPSAGELAALLESTSDRVPVPTGGGGTTIVRNILQPEGGGPEVPGGETPTTPWGQAGLSYGEWLSNQLDVDIPTPEAPDVPDVDVPGSGGDGEGGDSGTGPTAAGGCRPGAAVAALAVPAAARHVHVGHVRGLRGRYVHVQLVAQPLAVAEAGLAPGRGRGLATRHLRPAALGLEDVPHDRGAAAAGRHGHPIAG